MKTVAGGQARVLPAWTPASSSRRVAAWHTKLPGLPWNERNKEKAKRLLQEAGYKGEPIRFMTTQEYKWMYDFAAAHRSSSWRTWGSTSTSRWWTGRRWSKRRNNPKEYDVFTTGIGIGAQFDPTLQRSCPARGRAGPATRRSRRTPRSWRARRTRRSGCALWEQQTRLFYEKVPSIRYGDLFGLRAVQKTVKGFNESTERPRFYNVWLER